MKILFIAPHIFGHGGIQNYTRESIRTLKTLGHEVDAIDIFSPPGNHNHIMLQPASKLMSIMHRRTWEKKLRLHLNNLRKPYHLAIAAHICAFPATMDFATKTGTPWVGITYGIEAWGALKSAQLQALLSADRMIAISNFTKDRLLMFHQRQKSVTIIPPAVDTSTFTPDGQKPHPTKPRILTVARLDPAERYKGHDLIISALPSIIQSLRREVEYWIVGSGKDSNRLMELAKRLNVTQNVVFKGSVKDAEMPDLYRKCDLFAMPSVTSQRQDGSWTGEGLGIAYLEAAACAKPSIACNVGGQTDAVIHGKTGLLVEPNEENIASAIIELLLNTEKSKLMGEAAREYVAKYFSIETWENKWRGLLADFSL